jgi:hypothetical protein
MAEELLDDGQGRPALDLAHRPTVAEAVDGPASRSQPSPRAACRASSRRSPTAARPGACRRAGAGRSAGAAPGIEPAVDGLGCVAGQRRGARFVALSVENAKRAADRSRSFEKSASASEIRRPLLNSTARRARLRMPVRRAPRTGGAQRLHGGDHEGLSREPTGHNPAVPVEPLARGLLRCPRPFIGRGGFTIASKTPIGKSTRAFQRRNAGAFAASGNSP